MTTIASTLGVARSNLVERQARTAKPRGRYHKALDSRLLPLIRQLVDERPSGACPRRDRGATAASPRS